LIVLFILIYVVIGLVLNALICFIFALYYYYLKENIILKKIIMYGSTGIILFELVYIVMVFISY